MKKRMLLIGIGVFIFLLFVFFSYLVHKDIFKQLDFDVTVRLQDNIPRRADEIFSFFSDFGSFEPMLIFLIIILVILRKWQGIVAFALFGSFHLFEIYGKSFVTQLPPPQFLLRTKHLVDFPQFHVTQINSYPSGHAGRAVFLTVFLAIVISQTKRIRPIHKIILYSVLLGYDVIMLISRPYLGEHWATDVIGGAFLGASFGVISAAALYINPLKLLKTKNSKQLEN